MLKKKEIPVEAAKLSCVNAFGSKSSEAKATNEFQKLYRKAYEKRDLFFKNLLWPSFQMKLCLKKSNIKSPRSCLKILKKYTKSEQEIGHKPLLLKTFVQKS